ncbi:MAG: hypothetical protein ACI8SE_001971 [Bacteroidia bacterium]|jgi:hypothetical protein
MNLRYIFSKRNNKIERIVLIEDGFTVISSAGNAHIKWYEINKLTGFKMDRFTVDDICLEVESTNYTTVLTEEYEGWGVFMEQLLNNFPEVDKNWEGIIMQPPFKRNESILFEKKKKTPVKKGNA